MSRQGHGWCVEMTSVAITGAAKTWAERPPRKNPTSIVCFSGKCSVFPPASPYVFPPSDTTDSAIISPRAREQDPHSSGPLLDEGIVFRSAWCFDGRSRARHFSKRYPSVFIIPGVAPGVKGFVPRRPMSSSSLTMAIHELEFEPIFCAEIRPAQKCPLKPIFVQRRLGLNAEKL